MVTVCRQMSVSLARKRGKGSMGVWLKAVVTASPSESVLHDCQSDYDSGIEMMAFCFTEFILPNFKPLLSLAFLAAACIVSLSLLF